MVMWNCEANLFEVCEQHRCAERIFCILKCSVDTTSTNMLPCFRSTCSY